MASDLSSRPSHARRNSAALATSAGNGHLPATATALLTGLVGSAKALARAAHQRALTRDQAIEALAGIILAALDPLAHHGDHSG